jgi:hypothetical protein
MTNSEEKKEEKNEDKNEDKNEELLNIKWTKEHESILIDWGDKAMCYRWLHGKSNEDYSFKNTWYTIPVIVMSTITGTANFAQDQFPASVRGYAPMIIGSVNIIAGIITTVQQFLKITELNEAHRVSSIAWDKFYRKIKVELAKSPEERQNVTNFIKQCTEEYDRLTETSPPIEQKIINKFSDTFEGKIKKKSLLNICCGCYKKYRFSEEDIKKKKAIFEKRHNSFKEIKKPIICDAMESISKSVYKPPVNKFIEKKNHSIIDIVKEKKEQDHKERIILNFKENFKKEFHREPTDDEILDNLINEEKNMSMDKIKGVIGKWRSKRSSSVDNNEEKIEMQVLKKNNLDEIL